MDNKPDPTTNVPVRPGHPFAVDPKGSVSRAQWNFAGDRNVPTALASPPVGNGWGDMGMQLLNRWATPGVSPAMQASLSGGAAPNYSSPLARYYQQGIGSIQQTLPPQAQGGFSRVLQLAGPLLAAYGLSNLQAG